MNSANHLLLTRDKLDVGAISALVSNDSCGAISLFVGTTRDNFNDKRVSSLEYEAYEPMAVKQLQNICADIRSRWPDVADIAIHHRIGLVPVREASVVIGISSPHRKSALDAVALAIEQLKQKVPIWKKELYEGDESAWKENNESTITTSIECENVDTNLFSVEEVTPIPSGMIQISVEEDEIDKRITNFVKKKRQDIDLNNIMDYTEATNMPPNSNGENSEPVNNTSARTNTHIVKQDGSKCHLKVRRARNYIGPQTQPKYIQTLDKLISHEPLTKRAPFGTETNVKLSIALQRRLETVEDYLNLQSPNFKRDIYARLKAVEDRILHLESISPEYWEFMMDASGESITRRAHQNANSHAIHAWNYSKPIKHKAYTLDDLNSIIDQFEKCSDSRK